MSGICRFNQSHRLFRFRFSIQPPISGVHLDTLLLVLLPCLLAEPPEHRSDLRTARVARGLKIGADAVHDAGADRPLHRTHRPLMNVKSVVIAEDVRVLTNARVHLLVLRVAVQDGHKLLAGHGVVRAEATVVVTVDDTLCACRLYTSPSPRD